MMCRLKRNKDILEHLRGKYDIIKSTHHRITKSAPLVHAPLVVRLVPQDWYVLTNITLTDTTIYLFDY